MTTNSSSLVSDRYPAILKLPVAVGRFAVATRSTEIVRPVHGQSPFVSAKLGFSETIVLKGISNYTFKSMQFVNYLRGFQRPERLS
jgi:hypothetical protein